ncbi:hypothetical protein [Polymorphospora rubra]|uniref:Uncharacterized protein n=1 Tax=Polymorphospora rubra TaxID=338584 RepID=A0A810N7U9_9ACTN|nr:hypothetical protein [Polymorphospora rubra]BCJ69476.1 hypothetical protein Prubr_64970 [Polymorphospora rubra]
MTIVITGDPAGAGGQRRLAGSLAWTEKENGDWRPWRLPPDDPITARALAEHPADLISLCLAINVYVRGSFGPRILGGQVSGSSRRSVTPIPRYPSS